MNTLEAINNRTSYRGKYKNIKIPRTELQEILKAGLAAPSGCNKQTCSFIAVDDETILKKIGGLMQKPSVLSAPALICVLTQKIIAYKSRCFNVQDYSAAIQNMVLAIVEHGYESCWYEGQITDSDNIGRKIADLLNVPQEYELVCVLPVGVAEEEVKHAAKKPFEERAWFNGFMVD